MSTASKNQTHEGRGRSWHVRLGLDWKSTKPSRLKRSFLINSCLRGSHAERIQR